MAVVKVIDIIRNVETMLQDTNVRWPRTELQSWLNEAYLAILIRRPDANSISVEFTCAAGTRQKLTTQFSDALRLIDVVRNTAATSKKRSIRMVDRRILDDQRPDWHSDEGTLDIQHYMYDPRLPKEFFVYPPALATTKIEVVYSKTITNHVLTETELDPAGENTDVIQIDDVYAPAIEDYILYRSYVKDADYAGNESRATGFFNAFKSHLGDKNATDAAIDPKPQSKVT